jgi:hypothetical protein
MWNATAMGPVKEALQDVTLAGKYKLPKVCRSWLDVHVQSCGPPVPGDYSRQGQRVVIT